MVDVDGFAVTGKPFNIAALAFQRNLLNPRESAVQTIFTFPKPSPNETRPQKAPKGRNIPGRGIAPANRPPPMNQP